MKNRPDGQGPNFLVKLTQFVYAHHQKDEVWHEGEVKFDESIFIQALIKLAREYTYKMNPEVDGPGDSVNPWDVDWDETGMMLTAILIKQDIPSYFRKHLLKKYYKILSELALEKGYTKPAEKNILVDLRLGDVKSKLDYEGYKSAKFFSELINKGKDYDPHTVGIDEFQSPLSYKKINKIVRKVREKYPHHVLKFCAAKVDEVEEIYPDLKHEIISTGDPDHNLWVMMHSKVLIMARSTFDLGAGILHQGEAVYSPMWRQPASMGITSKYDKSNWITFY